MKSYYSPFPREKTNKEAMKHSYTFYNDCKKQLVDMPPSVTASYMKKNPFYFDLQSHKKRKNSQKTMKITKKTPYTLYNCKSLNNLLGIYNKQYIVLKPELEPGCEIMIPKPKKDTMKTNKALREITSSEALNVLKSIKIPNADKLGKVPEYINEFRVRDFIEKEYERMIDDERKYPKGTFRVWEKDRIIILNNLYIIREELMKELCLFPVDYYLRSIKINQARKNVEKRLDEIAFAIKIFELTKVFLKD